MLRSVVLSAIATLAVVPAALVSADAPADDPPAATTTEPPAISEPAPTTSTTSAPPGSTPPDTTPPDTTPAPTTATTTAPDDPAPVSTPSTTVPAEAPPSPVATSMAAVSTTVAEAAPTTDALPPLWEPQADTGDTDPADTTPSPAPRDMIVEPDVVDYVLATIRYLESRSRYDIPPNRGGASGAYQYIRSTWNNYAGYAAAYLAPPEVQDERARGDVLNILARWNHDVSMVPVIWYFPAAAHNPALMDIVPMPHAGNVLTVRQYQTRWLDTFAFITGQPLPPRPSLAGVDLQAGLPPVVPESTEPATVEIAYPLLGPSVVAPPRPCADDDCPTALPAIINGRQLQPVLAVADGVVTAVDHLDPLTGEIRLTITDAAGRSYHYSGFNDDTPGEHDGAAPDALRLTRLGAVGATVRAGQIIGFLGDSDASWVRGDQLAAAPRLRLWITDVDGTSLDADGAVQRAIDRQSCTAGIGPWSTEADPSLADDPLEEVDVDLGTAGHWTIDPSGRVRAVGAAALIYPTTGCTWAPTEPYGADSGGSPEVPADFAEPIDLPAEVWVTATVVDGGFRPAALLR